MLSSTRSVGTNGTQILMIYHSGNIIIIPLHTGFSLVVARLVLSRSPERSEGASEGTGRSNLVFSTCRQGSCPDGTIVTPYLINSIFLVFEKSLVWIL